MHQETEMLVQAIESLRQQDSFFKEFVLPIVGPFFSALLGAGVAFWTIKHQDNLAIQKYRVNTINDWMFLAEGAITSLIAIKSTYYNNLTNDPYQRASAVRTIIQRTKYIDKDFSSLSFLVPLKDDHKSQKVKWRQSSRLRAMIENYNFLLKLWDKRSEIDRPIKEKLMKDYSDKAYADLTKEQIIESVGQAKFSVLVDLTEKAITFTDTLIIEINDFLKEFPKVGKSLIKDKYLQRYGPIITYNSDDNTMLKSVIKKSTEVDYTKLAELHGITVEEIKREFETGYEQK